MKRANISVLAMVAALLVGLFLLLYPPLSSNWNARRQSGAIAGYTQRLAAMEETQYEALLAVARDYNDALARRGNDFDYSAAQRQAFSALLGNAGEAVGYLEIPAIELRLPIYLGTEESVLQSGAGVLEGSSIPIGGESTHAVLTGHRGLPSATLFTHLDRLEAGDIFEVHVLGQTASYCVEDIVIVEPNEMDRLMIRSGEDWCTLVTCTPYGVNSHRMLVQGRRTETVQQDAAARVAADALQIRPRTVAVGLALPVLLVLCAASITGTARLRKERVRPSGKEL